MIAKRFREEIQKKDPRKYFTSFSTASAMPENHGSNQETPQTSPTCTTTLNVDPETNLPSASSSERPVQFRNVSMCEASLQESLRGKCIDNAQVALAKAIYFLRSPMMMVDNAHWKRAGRKIGEFGAGFDPPSYHVMQNDLLEKCYAQVKEHVQKVVLSNIELLGCSIVSDGWSNIQRKPWINVMIISPRGETFMFEW